MKMESGACAGQDGGGIPLLHCLFLCFCYIFNVFILVKYQGPLQFLCHLVLDYPSDLRCANTAAWYVLANFQGDGVSGK